MPYQAPKTSHALNPQPSVLQRVLAWNHENPILWIAATLFVASWVFAYFFGRVAHWTTGVAQGDLASFCRWDCSWFSNVVDFGYDRAPKPDEFRSVANWAFFPLFPMSAKACAAIFRLKTVAAAVLASKLELFGAILAFLLWLRPYLKNTNDYFFAGALVALNPYLIYAHAGYSEPLYFMLCCLGFWALERQQWVLAGLFGAALSATRMVGLVYALSFAIVVLRQPGIGNILRDRSLKVLLGLALCPLGVALFGIYLYHRAGDAMAFVHIQAGWGKAAGNPLTVIAHSIQQHGWFRVWILMAVGALLISLWLLRRYPEYGIFLAIGVIMPVSSGHSWGLARYTWWQAPLLFAIFLALRRSVPAQMLYLAFAAGMAAFMVLSWFSGMNIVV